MRGSPRVQIRAVSPDPAARLLLPGAQFADAFSMVVDIAGLSARAAAERAFGRSPPWLALLVAARNAIVAPFGLKNAENQGPQPRCDRYLPGAP